MESLELEGVFFELNTASVAVLRALYLMCKWPEIQGFFFILRLGRIFRCLVMCEGRGW